MKINKQISTQVRYIKLCHLELTTYIVVFLKSRYSASSYYCRYNIRYVILVVVDARPCISYSCSSTMKIIHMNHGNQLVVLLIIILFCSSSPKFTYAS